MDKGEILKKFSAEPDKYYKVKLFSEQGYERKSCGKCGRFFWTIDANRTNCPEDSEDTYSFIGNPPLSIRKCFQLTNIKKYCQKYEPIFQILLNHFIWTSGCPEISECMLAKSPFLKVNSHL